MCGQKLATAMQLNLYVSYYNSLIITHTQKNDFSLIQSLPTSNLELYDKLYVKLYTVTCRERNSYHTQNGQPKFSKTVSLVPPTVQVKGHCMSVVERDTVYYSWPSPSNQSFKFIGELPDTRGVWVII